MAYQQIFVDGRVWTFFTFGESPYPDPENDTWSDTIRYNIVGDTIIDNQIYKILHSSYGLKSLLRENIKEQKIWKYNEYSKNENLIMDFSLSVGDKLESMHPICENISYIKDKSGNILKQLSFDNNHLVWIEKYGHKKVIGDGASSRLLYVTEGNDTLIDFTKKQEYYKPIVVEGYSWNVVYSDGDDADEIYRYSTYREKIEGDSIVNGVAYKKLWEGIGEDMAHKHLLALVREDIVEQKVFGYNNGHEVLLFDLGVEKGDTICVFRCLEQLKDINPSDTEIDEFNYVYLVVEEIESIEDEKYGSLKKITYHDATEKDVKVVVYERYGLSSGWAISPYCMVVGISSGSMICAFDENGELDFKCKFVISGYGEVQDCYIDAAVNTSIELLQDETRHNKVFYDCENQRIEFDVEKVNNVIVYDATGSCLMVGTVDAEDEYIPLRLNTGIYVVGFRNEQGQMFYSKIVVK